VVVSGLLALTGTAPALAQRGGATETTKDAARERYRAAEEKFKAGNWAAAAELYKQAEDILPVPMTKYKIAVCRDRLGQTAEAIRWYQDFLAFNPAGKMQSEAAEASARIAQLRSKGPGQLRIAVSPPNAPQLVYVIDGGQPQYASPAISLGPGHHRVVVQAQGFDPQTVEVDIGANEAKSVSVVLNPATAVRVGSVPGGPGGPVEGTVYVRRRSNVPAFVLLGVAGAGAVAGGVLGGLAVKAKNDFNANPTNAGADKTQHLAMGADISFGIALAAAVTGVVLIATNPAVPQEAASLARAPERAFFVTPYAGPTGGGAALGLAF
jgi:hypothetical protein